tara:strand:+ start:61188 stop:61337 length:150 start_codon:yes stop_codon:yes gene_type:complete
MKTFKQYFTEADEEEDETSYNLLDENEVVHVETENEYWYNFDKELNEDI